MEEQIVYIAELPYKVDFEKKSLIRMDKPEQELRAKDLKNEGDYYSTLLYKDTRLPQKELLEWDESQRLSFRVVVPKYIFKRDFWNDDQAVRDLNNISRQQKLNIFLGNPVYPSKLAPPTSKVLPEIKVAGTTFLVDVDRMELRQKSDSKNTISLIGMGETEGGYHFRIDKATINLPEVHQIMNHDESLQYVKIPELVTLDPEGMAQKYGLELAEVKGKTDFEVMVDQQALDRRTKGGQLITVEIEGHTFYVDFRMQMLRPKDDFVSKGIPFDDIEPYYVDEYDRYIFPYDPKKHEFRDVPNDIRAIPKDLVLVEILPPQDLDRVGYNRYIGIDEKSSLKETGIKLHHVARRVEWKEMGVDKLVQENIRKHIKEDLIPRAEKNAQARKRGKGRRI